MKKFALVIGCSKMEHMQQLPAVEKDVQQISGVFTKFKLDIQVVMDKQAAEVKTSVEEFGNKCRDEKAGLAVIYIAGHGQAYSVGSKRQTVHVIAPCDFVPETGNNSLGLAWLGAQCEQIAEHTRLVVFIDCCYTGAACWRNADKNTPAQPIANPFTGQPFDSVSNASVNARSLQRFVADGSRHEALDQEASLPVVSPKQFIIFSASQSEEIALEEPTNGGLFTSVLCDTLNMLHTESNSAADACSLNLSYLDFFNIIRPQVEAKAWSLDKQRQTPSLCGWLAARERVFQVPSENSQKGGMVPPLFFNQRYVATPKQTRDFRTSNLLVGLHDFPVGAYVQVNNTLAVSSYSPGEMHYTLKEVGKGTPIQLPRPSYATLRKKLTLLQIGSTLEGSEIPDCFKKIPWCDFPDQNQLTNSNSNNSGGGTPTGSSPTKDKHRNNKHLHTVTIDCENDQWVATETPEPIHTYKQTIHRAKLKFSKTTTPEELAQTIQLASKYRMLQSLTQHNAEYLQQPSMLAAEFNLRIYDKIGGKELISLQRGQDSQFIHAVSPARAEGGRVQLRIETLEPRKSSTYLNIINFSYGSGLISNIRQQPLDKCMEVDLTCQDDEMIRFVVSLLPISLHNVVQLPWDWAEYQDDWPSPQGDPYAPTSLTPDQVLYIDLRAAPTTRAPKPGTPAVKPLQEQKLAIIDVYITTDKIEYHDTIQQTDVDSCDIIESSYGSTWTDSFTCSLGTQTLEDRWEVHKHLIGKGSYGSVYAGYDRETQHNVAIKEQNCDESTLEELKKMQLLCSHPNIVQYIGSVQKKSRLYIIMEYCQGGTLRGIMDRFGNTFPPAAAKRYTLDILQGLHFLHAQNKTAHRDVKPANILIDNDITTENASGTRAKLADFGVSRTVDNTQSKTTRVVGSPLYIAPEAIKGITSTKQDIWALGIVVMQMLGVRPYEDMPKHDTQQLWFQVASKDNLYPYGTPQKLSSRGLPPDAVDFIVACNNRSVEQRPTAEQLMSHDWVKDVREHPTMYSRVSSVASSTFERETSEQSLSGVAPSINVGNDNVQGSSNSTKSADITVIPDLMPMVPPLADGIGNVTKENMDGKPEQPSDWTPHKPHPAGHHKFTDRRPPALRTASVERIRKEAKAREEPVTCACSGCVIQ